jgi:hypothetical protein
MAYAIRAYVNPCEETPSAGARIYVKCIPTGLELHVVGGDSEIPNFEAALAARWPYGSRRVSALIAQRGLSNASQ